MNAIDQMIVSDLSPDDVRKLMEQYEFQIRSCLRTVRVAHTLVEAKIALKAAIVARTKLAFLMEHAA